MFFQISQNSQENNCASDSFLIKLQEEILRNFKEHLFWQNTSGCCFWLVCKKHWNNVWFYSLKHFRKIHKLKFLKVLKWNLYGFSRNLIALRKFRWDGNIVIRSHSFTTPTNRNGGGITKVWLGFTFFWLLTVTLLPRIFFNV